MRDNNLPAKFFDFSDITIETIDSVYGSEPSYSMRDNNGSYIGSCRNGSLANFFKEQLIIQKPIIYKLW